MTDDRTLAALDQRGRAAAAGVRAAVADRPVPVLDPDVVRIDVDGRPEPRGRGRRSRPVVGLLAAAAAVLVVVAAVVALTVDGDPDSAPADQVRPGGPLRFTLATPPEGHVLAGVYDAATAPAPSAGETTSFGPLTVYGPSPSTAPTRRRR
ncbi:MAG TPA: hypothetical protein VFU19_08000 [Iamia sp.]|nr:hypothetical protein [Iamia sp.]